MSVQLQRDKPGKRQNCQVCQLIEEAARILDYYHIRWEYEPRTFDLEWDEMGAVSVAFTPDFYLPDEDLYVELTTLRPKLMRQKNAKLRRMAELYPDVKIKLFKRQDLRDMMIKYGMDEEAEQLLGTEAMTPLPATNGRSDPA